MHLVYPSRSRWKSLCQINKQGTACSLSVGGKKWWQTLHSPSEPQVKSTAAQQFIYSARKCRCHLYLDVLKKKKKRSSLTSSPHSVTVTSFPDMSMRWRVLLDTSRLDLVVRRVASSALLHTPITSVKQQRHTFRLFTSIMEPRR